MSRRTDVLALKAKGLTYREIADRLGCSVFAAKSAGRSEASQENSRLASNEAKRRRTGTCEVCGVPTSYNGRPGTPISVRCPRHAQDVMRSRRGSGPTQQRLFDLLDQHGEMHYMEIAHALDMTKNRLAVLLHRLLQYGLIVRVRRGVYTRA